jgi:hypothetical protein
MGEAVVASLFLKVVIAPALTFTLAKAATYTKEVQPLNYIYEPT